MAALDAAGRASYLRFQLWDVLNPVLMAIALGHRVPGA